MISFNHNIYIGERYFEVLVNDHSCSWFNCRDHSTHSFDFVVSRNPAEYDGFNYVYDMYIVQGHGGGLF